MNKIGIPSSKEDDKLLTQAVIETVNEFVDNVVNIKGSKFPDNWRIEISSPKLYFTEIIRLGLKHGESKEKLEERFGGDIVNSKIIADAPIVNLVKVLSDEKNLGIKYEERYPLFIGEMKKQGTNDKRLEEGKEKQAQGNAAAERVLKNWMIFKQYCYYCDDNLFPYVVFLHGCDFSKNEITTTTLSKLKPFFGELNTLNIEFKSDCDNQKYGGSCLYRNGNYSFEELKFVVYKCLEKGIELHINKEEKNGIVNSRKIVFNFSE